MVRKKVRLAYITNNAARKATFKKRKMGLMKKVSELCTLCGIDVCMIICCPYDPQPQVWPSVVGVDYVLEKFNNMSLIEKDRKMLNPESYMEEKISKVKKQLRKVERDNHETRLEEVIFRYLKTEELQSKDLNLLHMVDLKKLIDHKLDMVKNRMKTLTDEEIKNQNLQTDQVVPDYSM